MNKIGEKFIDGKMVSLDKELIENLEKMAKNVEQKEQSMKIDLDGIINQMINE